ncbi:hypothetical protein CYY_006558 [Polysphondylium violaceum]|uniref:Kinesin motor domain-containing protein n=1 Tax=Polysphondylium violaceum TaxID=133409 RepID=A0A8J4PR54_9MYCE|nr:hypothetical protein CYY_006558 [Polysphondylium violaceum]
MNENVIVAVRARPFNPDEIKGSEHSLWSLNYQTIASLPPPTLIEKNMTTPIKGSTTTTSTTTSIKTPMKTPMKSSISTPMKSTTATATPMKTPSRPSLAPVVSSTSKFVSNAYSFDHLFAPDSDNMDIYEKVAKKVIKSSMEGINASILAYGQTASGKTYTMKGTGKKNPGIIPLSIQDVFTYIQQASDKEFLLRVSYLEIYNEVINDLLAPENINLKIHEDPNGQIYVGNLKEEIVLSLDHVMSLISAGEAHRHVGTTNYNDQSSRSHTIFRMIIESKDIGGDATTDGASSTSGKPVRYSCLNLIDLAGSEKASDGLNAIRNKEGAYINKSLLTLGTVISKLSEKANGHVPFRDSKLTRILQNSLSGNSRVAIICTITLASNNFEETHNTLKFASRAKQITNNAKINEIVDDKALLKQYRHEIAELKSKLNDALNVEKSLQTVQSEKEKVVLNNEELSNKLLEAEKTRTMLESKIQHLTKLILVSSSIGNMKTKSGFSSPSQSSANQVATSSSSLNLTPSSINSQLSSISISSPNDNGSSSNNISTMEKELMQLQSKITKMEFEMEEKNRKIEFLNNFNPDTGLEKIKELESELVQRDMDLSLYQRESNRLQSVLTQKEDKINQLESKLRDILSKCKELEQENQSLKSKVDDYEVMY